LRSRVSGVIEVEVIGRRRLAANGPSPSSIRRLCELAAGSAGVGEGHLAVHFVDEDRIAELNARHRGKPEATDVLAFPIDGAAHLAGDAAPGVPPEGRQEATDRVRGAQASDSPPRELGDVVICPARTIDLREAVVHGVLHLVGMDHETDEGEMLALQAQLLAADARR
jgi:probable rRNA maturation factor